MKKILILAYDFPPYVSVGGLRPHYWYEHFKEMGIYPIVVTRNWNPIHGNELDYIQPSVTNEVVIEETNKGTLIKTPYRATLSNRLNLKGKNDKFSNLLKKISTGWNEIGQWFFPVGTKYELYKAAKNYLKENKVDAIIATGEPFVLFRYASMLSSEFDIPWIADYRDPWSNNAGRSKTKLTYWFNAQNERRTLSNATRITTVSDFLRRKIEQIIGERPITILPNGYNETVFEKLEAIPQNSETLTISLAGTLYNWHPYLSFLEVIANYLQRQPTKKLKIVFYGNNKSEEINQLIKELPVLKEIVVFYPRLSHEKLVAKIATSNVLLLFNDYAIMGTKIYDYLALNRRIILCYENDVVANILREKYYTISTIKGLSEQLQADLITATNSGIIVKDKTHLEEVLDELFQEFETKKAIENTTQNATNYSRRHQTEQLATLLKELN